MKIGVNDKCHCGSKKKYKKCCMWADEELKEVKENINKNISDLSQEEIDEINKQEAERYEKDHAKFVEFFQKGECCFCEDKLDSFNPEKPCFHWFLYPTGIKKKDFETLIGSMRLFRTMAYLRWVANQENILGNINDLDVEKDDSRIFEHTIKYKNLEWSFCCAKCDYSGHGSFNFPHYHFEMKVDGRRFIGFHDFHIKMDKEDLFELDTYLGKNEKVQHGWWKGAGMQDLYNLGGEKIIKTVRTAEDESKAQIHLGTWVESKDGEPMRGEDLEKAFKMSRETGRSITDCIREVLPDNPTQTIISPGDGVVEMRHRGGRGKKKDGR